MIMLKFIGKIKLKYYIKIIIGILMFVPLDGQSIIRPEIFGQNFWLPDFYGGNLTQLEQKLLDANVKTIRVGGIAPDQNPYTHLQILNAVEYIQNIGAEPIIQVALQGGSVNDAISLIQYINITQNKNVKYWSIGNEPDQYDNYSPTLYATNFRIYAEALKNIDPNIKLVGPDIANPFYPNSVWWIDQFLEAGGNDLSSFGYIDIFSIHYYAFDGNQIRDEVINSHWGLKDRIEYIIDKINQANIRQNRYGNNSIKLAITEMNINYINSISDDLYGNGANSFIGGQWWAESLGEIIKNDVEWVNFWSIAEGEGEYDLGFISLNSYNEKPSYHHFNLVSNYLYGNYKYSFSNNPSISTLASSDDSTSNLLILNRTQNDILPITVRLDTLNNTNTNNLINLNSNLNCEYNDNLIPESTVLYQFSNTGSIIKKIIYDIDIALQNSPPQTINFIIDNFNNNELINWWSNPDIYQLSVLDGSMVVNIENAGPGWETFGKNIEIIDLTMTPEIKFVLKVSSPTSPIIRVDLQDIFGKSTNGEIVTIIPEIDGNYHEYILDFSGKFFQAWPEWSIVDSTKINNMLLFINPGGEAFSGEILIDNIQFINSECVNISGLPGDINQDGIINIIDIVQVISFILDEIEFNNIQLQLADINNDNNINIVDVVIIVGIIIN